MKFICFVQHMNFICGKIGCVYVLSSIHMYLYFPKVLQIWTIKFSAFDFKFSLMLKYPTLGIRGIHVAQQKQSEPDRWQTFYVALCFTCTQMIFINIATSNSAILVNMDNVRIIILTYQPMEIINDSNLIFNSKTVCSFEFAQSSFRPT